jgi:hypothetical protein
MLVEEKGFFGVLRCRRSSREREKRERNVGWKKTGE